MEISDLPSYESNRIKRGWPSYSGEDYPYNRVVRFLMHSRGKNVDEVFAEYMKADWVPVRYRNHAEFKRRIEIDTFIGEDGKIWYHESLAWRGNSTKSIEEENSRNFFYVDPTTKTLLHKPKVGPNYTQIWKERKEKELAEVFRYLAPGRQLSKYKGIWYEVTFNASKMTRYYDHITKTYRGRDRTEEQIEKMEKSYLPPEKWGTGYGFSDIENFRKRQISAKELKKHNLKND